MYIFCYVIINLLYKFYDILASSATNNKKLYKWFLYISIFFINLFFITKILELTFAYILLIETKFELSIHLNFFFYETEYVNQRFFIQKR